MPATKIDGNAVSATIRDEIKKEVDSFLDSALKQAKQAKAVSEGEGAEHQQQQQELSEAEIAKIKLENTPGLAVIIVGSRGDSQTYVRLKHQRAEECNYHSIQIELPEESTTDEIVNHVNKLNADSNVHGILVQLPLPKQVDEVKVLDAIRADKDVDGLHPMNVGFLYLRGRTPLAVPCTPLGCIELLKRSNVRIEGKRAVVIGRSNIVGLPVAQLLLQENATVTIAHSKSENLADIVREADIVVAAVGKAAMVKGDWIKKGAVVIDVGTNAIPDATKKSGMKLVGDVDFEAATENASLITPVPGGVGPMTIAMLLKNTLTSFKRLKAQEEKK